MTAHYDVAAENLAYHRRSNQVAKANQFALKPIKCGSGSEFSRTKQYFYFKPVLGCESKGIYRNSKPTQCVFKSILNQDYTVQTIVHATGRSLKIGGSVTIEKVDVCLYSYDGQFLLCNMRTYKR